MSAAGLVRRGRRAAERDMSLTLAAYSPDATTTDANGFNVPAFASEGSTVGKVQAGAQAGQDAATRHVTVGGVARPVLSGGLHIPIGAPVPVGSEQRGLGWEYEVTAVGAGDDPALLGRRFLVVGVPVKSYATARRLDVVEV